MRKIAFGTFAAVLAIVATPAAAAEFLFSFSGATINGSGTFITSDTPDDDGGFEILSSIGNVTINGDAFTLSGPTDFVGADNLLFVGSEPLLTFNGTSFDLSDGRDLNVYYSGGAGAYRYITSGGSVQAIDSFTISEVVAAVPEPASWAMMISGFGLVGGAMRSRATRRLSYSA
jgi:hypothetical protein